MQAGAGKPGMGEDDEEMSADIDDEKVDLVDDDDDDDDGGEDTVVFSPEKGADNVGDVSVEINVEELIAEFEALEGSDAARQKHIRRRLEEIREQRETMRDLEDTFSFYLNDDD